VRVGTLVAVGGGLVAVEVGRAVAVAVAVAVMGAAVAKVTVAVAAGAAEPTRPQALRANSNGTRAR
jgi:hypothetical protein